MRAVILLLLGLVQGQSHDVLSEGHDALSELLNLLMKPVETTEEVEDSTQPLLPPTEEVNFGEDKMSLGELLGSLFDLPRRPAEPEESGFDLLTTEEIAETWKQDQFPELSELRTLVRQNIYEKPPPLLNALINFMADQETQQAASSLRRRRRLFENPLHEQVWYGPSVYEGDWRRRLQDEISNLNTDSSLTGNTAAGSSGSSITSLLNPTDILSVLDLINGGVNLGQEVVTGRTTTQSPVQKFANGISSIVYGAKELNSVFASLLNLSEGMQQQQAAQQQAAQQAANAV